MKIGKDTFDSGYRFEDLTPEQKIEALKQMKMLQEQAPVEAMPQESDIPMIAKPLEEQVPMNPEALKALDITNPELDPKAIRMQKIKALFQNR